MFPNTLPLVACVLALGVPATAGQSPPDSRQAHGGLTGEIKPVLYVSDVQQSAPFYRDTLGFQFLGYAGPADDPYYADMAAATVKFGLHEPTAEPQHAMVGRQRLYFRVRDLEAHRSRVVAWGGEPGAVRETGWMDMFIVRDRDGNEIVFAATDPIRHAIDPWHVQRADAPSVGCIDIDFPHGETRLQVRRHGEAYLYYGASIRHKVIRPGTFDIDTLHEQLEPRLHENVPRDQWPDPQARAGMVSIRYEDRSDRDLDFLIFDGPFAEALFERARVNIIPDMVAVPGACPSCAAPPSPWADAQHDTARGFQDPLLDRLAGTWVLEGMMAGGDVVHDVTAEWVTGHQYLRLVELSRERTGDGTRAYEAIVFIGWDAEHERYACLWLDSTGGSGLVNGIIGYAASDSDRLAFLFDFGDESRFHTTFTCDRERDVWELRMDSERDGGFQPFARATMTRRD